MQFKLFCNEYKFTVSKFCSSLRRLSATSIPSTNPNKKRVLWTCKEIQTIKEGSLAILPLGSMTTTKQQLWSLKFKHPEKFYPSKKKQPHANQRQNSIHADVSHLNSRNHTIPQTAVLSLGGTIGIDWKSSITPDTRSRVCHTGWHCTLANNRRSTLLRIKKKTSLNRLIMPPKEILYPNRSKSLKEHLNCYPGREAKTRL